MSEDIAVTTTGFAGEALGLKPYDWQARALLPLEKASGQGFPGRRQNIAVCAPNGSGKDMVIIPAAAYYWLCMNPQGQVVITSESHLQLTKQTIINLDDHYRKFGWEPPVRSPQYTLRTPTGGELTAFVTNTGARIEGFHSKPGRPLLGIINEAKSFDEDMWQGIDRWTVDALMIISSPGLKMGRFFDAFHKNRSQYTCIMAGLSDCPHIPQDDIDFIIQTHGEKGQVTRSRLYGEFMDADSEDPYCITIGQVQACIQNPPSHLPGFRYGFFDFADGRAENVLVIRDGNKYEIADAWREENKDAVIGRALHLLNKNNLRPEQVGADAAAKDILDAMASSGYPIHRQNFGATAKYEQYKSWMGFAWLTGCQKIIDREVIIPDDPILMEQLSSRKKIFTVDGKLSVEDKLKMLRERNVKSPDRADALFGAMSAFDTNLFKSAFVDIFAQNEQSETNSAFSGISVGL